jgi:hypothetical protein
VRILFPEHGKVERLNSLSRAVEL